MTTEGEQVSNSVEHKCLVVLFFFSVVFFFVIRM